MAQQLGDVLSGRNYAEPPEVRQIKAFVENEIGIIPNISITPDAYVIRIKSAAGAGALRSKLFKLQKQIESEKRLVIRIS